MRIQKLIFSIFLIISIFLVSCNYYVPENATVIKVFTYNDDLDKIEVIYNFENKWIYSSATIFVKHQTYNVGDKIHFCK